MKFQDITKKTDKELTALLADTRKQLLQASMDMRTKQVKNVKQIAALKTTIARALTEQRQRELTHVKEENNG
jgi:ribosomal protein L29